MGFNGLYGQDSFEYLLYSRSLHDFMLHGSTLRVFHWPVLYPLAGAFLSFLMNEIYANQVISICSYGLALYFLQKTLWVLYPEKKRQSSLLLLLFYGISPFVVRNSSTVMSDPLTIFFISAFLFFFLRFIKGGMNKDFVLGCISGSSAMNTRYAAIVLLIIPMMVLIIRFCRHFKLIPFMTGVVLAILTFLPGIFLHYAVDHGIISHMLIPGWSIGNMFRHSFITTDGNFNYPLPNIVFVILNLVHPGFIFIGIVLLVMIRKDTLRNPLLFFIVIAFILYTLFLAGLQTQNPRFSLLSFPFLILLYAGPFSRILEWIKKRLTKNSMVMVGFIIIVIQISLTYRAFVPFYRDSQNSREVAQHMKIYPGKTIYTMNIDMALEAYGIKNKIVNIWEKRIEKVDEGSLILFNYAEFNLKWKGKNPMLNWEILNKDYHLHQIEILPGNWELYETCK